MLPIVGMSLILVNRLMAIATTRLSKHLRLSRYQVSMLVGYRVIRISGYHIITFVLSGYQFMRTSGSPVISLSGDHVSSSSRLQVFRLLSVRLSGYQCITLIRLSGYPVIRLSGIRYTGIRLSGIRYIRLSGYQV